MSDQFDLEVTADSPSRTAEFHLRDGHGSLIAYRRADFNAIAISRRQGLFDLRNYLRDYVEDGKEAASVAEIGVCIAEEVLGAEIFRKLWESNSQRTLRIQLPGASEEENLLAAALARVPWEIARPAAEEPALGERHLLVRVVHDMAEPKSTPLTLGPDESLRVLFVFAEAWGSRPLAARRERQELLERFRKEIYPKRRVVAHVLSHGVTRERFEAQNPRERRLPRHPLERSRTPEPPRTRQARWRKRPSLRQGAPRSLRRLYPAARLPSAPCHSGDILSVRSWNDFLAVAQGQSRVPSKARPPRRMTFHGTNRQDTQAPRMRCSKAACRAWLPCGMRWAMNMLASWASLSIAPACLRTAAERRGGPDDRPAIAARPDQAGGFPLFNLRSRHARLLRRRRVWALFTERPQSSPRARSPAAPDRRVDHVGPPALRRPHVGTGRSRCGVHRLPRRGRGEARRGHHRPGRHG